MQPGIRLPPRSDVFIAPFRPLSTVRGALDDGSIGYLMLLASAMRPRNARHRRPVTQVACKKSSLSPFVSYHSCGNPKSYYNHLWKPSIWHSKCFCAGGGSKSGAALLDGAGAAALLFANVPKLENSLDRHISYLKTKEPPMSVVRNRGLLMWISRPLALRVSGRTAENALARGRETRGDKCLPERLNERTRNRHTTSGRCRGRCPASLRFGERVVPRDTGGSIGAPRIRAVLEFGARRFFAGASGTRPTDSHAIASAGQLPHRPLLHRPQHN